ncbi:Helicase associated domain protein, partial [Kitasatospora sp. NPDC057198]|uniref:DEAD/DEAH box helicase n=1 Tax=Kitasatospora sp. NPDC057198 TaxID=3346046 RepID=UPI00362FA936
TLRCAPNSFSIQATKPSSEATSYITSNENSHQEETLEAIVRALTPRPGRVVPAGLRATVQLATGTGKSFVGAVAAQRLAPRGLVMVVVPTLDLLTQMRASWVEAGRAGKALAVCSLVQEELPEGVPRTTHPLVIGSWIDRAAASGKPLTLYTTYASAGAVEDAYAAWREREGRELVPLDLMVCDEAHRSSGSAEKAWTVVHDQEAIPSARRLYMTATPRVWQPPKRRRRDEEGGQAVGEEGGQGRRWVWQPLPEELAVSMDDQAIYGPQVYTLGLAEAIDRGLLAPFEVVVLELRDPETDPAAAAAQPVPWGAGAGEAEDGSEDQVPVKRVAAMQAGLLKVAAEHGLQCTITFHPRTLEARYFAETLNQTAERLHAEDPDGFPEEVWSQWLSGEHPVDYRRWILGDFGKSEEYDGLAYRVLANCRVLGEGVDIPGADSILLQGRGSMVDIVQAIGRSLRMKPGEGKVARIIVPVFLRAGEQPGDIMESESYGPLIKVLTAIRSHDARLVEALAVPQRSGRRTTGARAEIVGAPGEGEGAEEATGAFTLPVRFQSKVSQTALALFVATQVFRSESVYWKEGMQHCAKWVEEHGSLDVPYNAMVGKNGNFPLGKWLSDRRHERSTGDMPAYRVVLLDSLGMIWSVSDARFEAGLAWARQWAAEHHGSLAAPSRASIGGYAIGTWLVELRAQAEVPDWQDGALPQARRAALEAIDPWWCPAWPITWQRSYAACRAWWLAGDGVVDWPGLPVETGFEGEAIGRWVRAQRGSWAQLAEEQRDLLLALGIEEDQELAAAAAEKASRPVRGRGDRFAQHLEALRRFAEREGHVRVPRAHKEPLEGVEGGQEPVLLGLGAWLSNQRSRRAKLSFEQLRLLGRAGVEWAAELAPVRREAEEVVQA